MVNKINAIRSGGGKTATHMDIDFIDDSILKNAFFVVLINFNLYT